MTEITDLSSPVLWLIVGLLWGSMLAVIISEHCSRTRDAIERERELERWPPLPMIPAHCCYIDSLDPA